MITVLPNTNVLKYFDQHDVDLAHGCNCMTTMGAGIAKGLRDRWPQVYHADCQTVKGDHTKLGKFTYADVGSKRIYNLYSQYKYGRDKKYFAPRAFQIALLRVFFDMSIRERYSLIIPWIGTYNAGGTREEIMRILEDTVPTEINLFIGELDYANHQKRV